jgi:arginyl-tRNA synthetase
MAVTPPTVTPCAGLLRFSGHDVATEFYINDFGRQMDRFGRSVAARYSQSYGVELPVPEDGYQGDYVKDVAAVVRQEAGDRWVARSRSPPRPYRRLRPPWRRATRCPPKGRRAWSTPCPWKIRRTRPATNRRPPEAPSGRPIRAVREAIAFFRARGCELMLEAMRTELRDFGVEFDIWFSETTLHVGGRLQAVIDRLLASGEAFREETPYGCAPPAAATTRTACSSAATDSPRISPPISPTTKTNSSGASAI